MQGNNNLLLKLSESKKITTAARTESGYTQAFSSNHSNTTSISLFIGSFNLLDGLLVCLTFLKFQDGDLLRTAHDTKMLQKFFFGKKKIFFYQTNNPNLLNVKFIKR